MNSATSGINLYPINTDNKVYWNIIKYINNLHDGITKRMTIRKQSSTIKKTLKQVEIRHKEYLFHFENYHIPSLKLIQMRNNQYRFIDENVDAGLLEIKSIMQFNDKHTQLIHKLIPKPPADVLIWNKSKVALSLKSSLSLKQLSKRLDQLVYDQPKFNQLHSELDKFFYTLCEIIYKKKQLFKKLAVFQKSKSVNDVSRIDLEAFFALENDLQLSAIELRKSFIKVLDEETWYKVSKYIVNLV